MNEVDELLKRIDYPGFYHRHIPGFNPNGKKEVLCLCPFHEDKEPSFSVNTETGLWNCFSGCGGGNVIQFLEKKEGLTFKDALQSLKTDEGISDTPAPARVEKKPAANAPRAAFLNIDQVKNLHQQLTRDETVLKKFQSKYGLSLETIEKYLIGYQGGHYVIPIEIEPGKWKFKEHKGNQLRGSKVTLYPAGIIKEGLTYIITEGEFKALFLNQMDIPAVSGTGGANTWKKEWTSLFAGQNVIFAYDNDDPGRQGALKAAEALKFTAKSVKAIQWPSYMDGNDKKDVTDFFLTCGKTRDDFQRLIDHAKDIVREVKEIDGIKFIEPEGFEVTDQSDSLL